MPSTISCVMPGTSAVMSIAISLFLQSLLGRGDYPPDAASPRVEALGSLVVGVAGDLGPRLVAGASLPDRGQQDLELLALGGLEAVEQLGLHPIHDLGDPLDHGDPLLRDLHEVPAAILGIAAALRVAPLLE